MRLIVARCEVRYTGRLTAVLPLALRLIMVKSDGSVMVHADTGGFKPQNWMTPPTVLEWEGEPLERLVVRKFAGKSEDKLDVRIEEVVLFGHGPVLRDATPALRAFADALPRD